MSNRSGSAYSLPRDANRVPAAGGVLASDGKTINPLLLDSSGNLLVNNVGGSALTLTGSTSTNPLNTIVSNYALANGITIQYAYQDDFSEGFQGWQNQYDTSNPGRCGITLTGEARMGNYALEVHTPATINASSWARKGFVLPSNLKKMIFGCYFSIHAENLNYTQDIAFDIDTQFGTGSGTGTNRYFFSVRYLNYLSGIQQKWQVQTNTATSQTFTDVSGGAMPIPWNESVKPMLCYMVVVIDYTTKTYEKLYSSGNTYDLTGLSGPAASASLLNFDMGVVNIARIENRSDSAHENILTMEKPFLAWGF